MAIKRVGNKSRKAAENYLSRHLAEGTTLARLISDQIDFSLGIFRVIIPESADTDLSLDFSSGNSRLSGDEEVSFACLIRSFTSDPGCALLIQDNEFTISELSVGQQLPYGHLAVSYNTEVYWAVSKSVLNELTDDQILDIVHNASYFPWLGFFYLNGLNTDVNRLSDHFIKHFGRRIIGIAVGAFDYRSFLIWWRDDLVPFPAVATS